MSLDLRCTWFLQGGRNLASSRLQGYLIHEKLLALGLESQILLAPPFVIKNLPWPTSSLADVADRAGVGVAILQKLEGARVEPLIRELRHRGIITVYVESDWSPAKPYPGQCDHVVVPSRFLRDFFQSKGIPCTQILDPIEIEPVSPEQIARFHRKRGRSSPLRLVWVGHPENFEALTHLRVVLERRFDKPFKILTISSHPHADFPWSLKTLKKQILLGDVGVVPTLDGPGARAKSHNRVTLFMALGLPVVAGDIPAYQEIVMQGSNGFITRTEDGWIEALRELTDPERRVELAISARAKTVPRFHIDHAVDRWLRLIEVLYPTGQREQSVMVGRRMRQIRTRLRLEEQAYYLRVSSRRRRWSAAFRAALRTAGWLARRPSSVSWLAGEWASAVSARLRRRAGGS